MSSLEKRPSLTPSFPLSSKQTSRVITAVESPNPHLGWHSRGYLPHWDHPGMIQSINFRLGDSLPSSVIAKIEAELSPESPSKRGVELRRRIEEYLDVGHGKCCLRMPAVAKLAEDALMHVDGERYRLLSWCVMPNHIHVLIETQMRFSLSDVLHSWKSFIGHEANKILCRSGEFWQREYLDRYVRNEEHYEKIVAYIEENPVKAGLAKIKTDWLWSSAKFRKPGSAAVPTAS
jgi:REP element-mobilizing transposase RayT